MKSTHIPLLCASLRQASMRTSAESKPLVTRAHATAIAFVCIAIMMAASAHATTIIAPTVDEMTVEADAVIVGVVEGVSVEQSEQGIVRRVTIRVHELWKADCANEIPCPVVGEPLIVTAQGGRTADHATRVFGAEDYVNGEEVLIFLQNFQNSDDSTSNVVDWHSHVLAWTKFSIESSASGEDRAVRSVEGITPIARRADGSFEKLQTPADNDFSLSGLRQQVQEALDANRGQQ